MEDAMSQGLNMALDAIALQLGSGTDWNSYYSVQPLVMHGFETGLGLFSSSG